MLIGKGVSETITKIGVERREGREQMGGGRDDEIPKQGNGWRGAKEKGMHQERRRREGCSDRNGIGGAMILVRLYAQRVADN